MVAMYTIFGRQVGSHHLAMGILATTFGGVYYASRGGKKPQQNLKPGEKAQPPIQASSKEEEAFISEFLKNAAEEDKNALKQ